MANKRQQTTEIVTQADVGTVSVNELAGVDTFDDLKAHAGAGGLEKLGPGDVKPPRLLLAQSMSPQCKRSDPKYIEGLHEGDLFDSLTGEIYGGPKTQVEIVVIQFLGIKGIQLGKEIGDPVVDWNVPLDDPRMEFTTDPDDPKKRVKPIATKFYDYLIWLPGPQAGPMAISFKGTQIKTAAVPINSLMKQPLRVEGQIIFEPPPWARTFLLGSCDDKREKGTIANYTLALKGITSAETRKICAKFCEDYSKRNVVVDRDVTDAEVATEHDDVPF